MPTISQSHLDCFDMQPTLRTDGTDAADDFDPELLCRLGEVRSAVGAQIGYGYCDSCPGVIAGGLIPAVISRDHHCGTA